ncbi:unnamed protein product [Choristocarpus tenellus]
MDEDNPLEKMNGPVEVNPLQEKCSSQAQPSTARGDNETLLKGCKEDGELLDMLNNPLSTPRRPEKNVSLVEKKKTSSRRRKKAMTIRECAKWACNILDEPKYYLMCQVVAAIGYNKTKGILKRVSEVQKSGGMLTADKQRKRSKGGVFFTILKEYVEPKALKEIYADDNRVKKEAYRAKQALKRKAEGLPQRGEYRAEMGQKYGLQEREAYGRGRGEGDRGEKRVRSSEPPPC